jgi:mRNA interferase MazF
VKRGEVWTIAGGADYAGKPRPAVILQDDAFDTLMSLTICPLTTHGPDAPLVRVTVEPSEENGLRLACYLMVDKITTVPRTKCQQRLGRLSASEMRHLSRAVIVFLGLAGSRMLSPVSNY